MQLVIESRGMVDPIITSFKENGTKLFKSLMLHFAADSTINTKLI